MDSHFKNTRRLYPVETVTDADYAEDLAFLLNTPNPAQSLLQGLEQVTGAIENANKSECFKQGAISTLSGKPLKLAYQSL